MKKAFVFFLCLIFFSCTTNDDNVVDNRPVSEGIYITNETSPEHIAVWGNPGIPDNSKATTEDFSLETPYPNPASGHMWINIVIPNTTEGRIWLERARYINEKEEDYLEPFIEEIINQTFEEGSHRVNLSNGFKCGNDTENTLDQGFYRIYFESKEFYYWQDICILGYIEDTPEGLKNYSIEFCRDD